jgi:CRP-like cAMP-binding protein
MKDVVDPVFEEMDQSSTSLASLRAAFRECEEDSPGIVSEILKSMSDRM